MEPADRKLLDRQFADVDRRLNTLQKEHDDADGRIAALVDGQNNIRAALERAGLMKETA